MGACWRTFSTAKKTWYVFDAYFIDDYAEKNGYPNANALIEAFIKWPRVYVEALEKAYKEWSDVSGTD